MVESSCSSSSVRPSWQPQQQRAAANAALISSSGSSSSAALPAPLRTPRSTASPADGLPVLTSHASAWHVAATPPSAPPLWTSVDAVDRARANIRADLLRFYIDTNQIPAPDADTVKNPLALNRGEKQLQAKGVSEMTLRIDTELELLRRQCFMERNAQWHFFTPEMFAFAPAPPRRTTATRWQSHFASSRQTRKLRERDVQESINSSSTSGKHTTTVDIPLGEFARERPWPPTEFALKPTLKPARGRGGKRKVVVAVMEELPVVAKTCCECRTQSTPLWRKQTRRMEKKKTSTTALIKKEEQVVNSDNANIVVPLPVPAPAESASVGITGSGTTNEPSTASAVVVDDGKEDVEVDLCLTCYLKLERQEIFMRKKAEKIRLTREKQEAAATAAMIEKKRLQQQIQQLKKQQQLLKKQQKRSKKIQELSVTTTPSMELTSAVVTPVQDDFKVDEKTKKKDKKKGRKDKSKKKKKKEKEHADVEDSESDCLTPMPSPPQMAGYEYADLGLTSSRSGSSTMSFDTAPQEEPIQQQNGKSSARAASSSKRSRKSSKQFDDEEFSVDSNTSSTPVPKKLKRSGSLSAEVASPRKPRSKATTTPVAPPPPPTLPPPAPTPSARKRARTKKETAREIELRALGQYCPVCNVVYEDDDESSFVCCDSCEMWVHAACDADLTPEIVAALSTSSDKYICPLCAGR